jgi:mRNA-degrading endonuclease RelE of RelBE toxin-antitoxin system
MSEPKWRLNVTPKARDDLHTLPRKDAPTVSESIDTLRSADNPFAVPGVKKMKGSDDVWRQRSGNYRIFFQLESTPVTY